MSPPPVKLALQGGGSHGAFTWGVLDRLMEARVPVEAVSGTSAGAVNAALLLTGLAADGPEGARRTLRLFWERLGSPFLAGPADLGAALPWGEALRLTLGTLAPWQLNPLGLNPLRTLLDDLVEPASFAAPGAPALFVAATNVATGAARVFTGGEVTVDAILASAALPRLFRAVEIDGEAYWDGGFSGNPALLPLVEAGEGDDILLVRLTPAERGGGTPIGAGDIMDRMADITFGNALQREVEALELARRLARSCTDPIARRFARLRLREIRDDELFASLAPRTKKRTGAAFLAELFERGRAAADTCLASRETAEA